MRHPCDRQISALLTATYMVFTGEGDMAYHFLQRHPKLGMLLLLQSACGYFGIIAYLETVTARLQHVS